jgi:hypothetical protein
MLMYLGPSCANRSFSAKLDDAEIDAQIRWILVHGPIRIPSLARCPMGRGRQPLCKSAQAYSRLIVSISAFLTH